MLRTKNDIPSRERQSPNWRIPVHGAANAEIGVPVAAANHQPPTTNHRPPNGFTLAELLVSMAIFLTIMAGVAAVFVGSVDTVRQGYRNMEAFEIGRSTLGVLEQDLKNAFTARELGQYFQFYGTPNGFMIVGALDDGQLGRVTYAINEFVGTGSFETVITDSRGALRDRLVSQGQSLGISKDDATIQANLWMPGAGSEIIEERVIVNTGGLVRYAEPGVSDLDTLPLPSGLLWPNVDPTDPTFDTYIGEGANEDLYKLVLLALNPDAGALNDSRDIRTLIREFPQFVSNASLTAIRADTIKTLVEARKREIWIQMLAGDTDLADFWSGIGKKASDYVVADSVVVRAVPLDLNGVPLAWDLGGGLPTVPANLLYHPAFFFYSNSVQDYSPFYNALQNIEPPRGLSSGIGYLKYMEDPSYLSLYAFDRTLSNLLGETRLAADTLGSPLMPQLPNIVRPGFWLMKPATRPGGADFRRWFGQGIDVPSAFNRSVEASMVPNPNQV